MIAWELVLAHIGMILIGFLIGSLGMSIFSAVCR